MHRVLFNVLAKDLQNAEEIAAFDRERILVGVMVKNFERESDAVALVEAMKKQGIRTSVGLGAGDPAQWKKVADVSVKARPFHINQVYPAAGYTKGRLEETHGGEFLVNSLVEPSDEPGMVYISTGETSRAAREKVSCSLAAKLHRDIGLQSVKFFPIDGSAKLDHVRAMAKAAAAEGVPVFEPTGGISMENVHEIVQVCLDEGVETVIPHLYSSLVDKGTGKTRPEYIKELLALSWRV